MKKRIVLSLAAVGTALAMIPLFAAFEAHVINVTATIENALSVPLDSIEYGTVFPQEELDQSVRIALSSSFLAESDANDVEYVIKQKPKCQGETGEGLAFGRVIEDEGDNFICEDDGFEILPLLCPYLSKHPDGTDNSGNAGTNGATNDSSLDAFHGVINHWSATTTLAFEVEGRLVKKDEEDGSADTSDTWTIDLKVPCFGDNCGQDWENYVFGINSGANADDYIQPEGNEGALFGCDLWIEVTGVSRLSDD